MALKRNTTILVVAALTFSAIIGFVYIFKLLQQPMDPIPIDAGWIELLLILVNGFFLSVNLEKAQVGFLERLLLSVGLGFGLTFAVMILLGMVWQITLLTATVVQVCILVVLGAAAMRKGVRFNLDAFEKCHRNHNITRQAIIPAILLLIVFALTFLAINNAVSLPTIEWDSLAYGVNYAKIIFQNSNIPVIAGPSIGIEMSASYPPGVQVTAASFYAIAGSINDFYYRILSPIFGLFTLIVTYKFAMYLNKNRTFSLYAVSALAIIPIFWELFVNETYLMALTLMMTLSGYFFYKAYNATGSDTKKYEVIAALFCGFAALTSYMGLFAFGLLLLYAIHKKSSLKRILLSASLAFVVVAPWYLRNLILLQNPIYPFFGVGNNLDPLLWASTVQHFQQYKSIPLYAWTALLSEVGAVLLVLGITFFTFFKSKKNFLVVIPLNLLLVTLVIMAVHAAFPRYIILSLPVLAVVFSKIIKSLPTRLRLQQVASIVFVVFAILASAAVLPYASSIKPQTQLGEDKGQYLSRVLEEGDAWQWINKNMPLDTKIATFDIKEYYLNRTCFPLDGEESAPLYRLNSIQESIAFLQENGVGYVLSVPWASPSDNRLPPAYTLCLLTRYLGDPDYLPPVFTGRYGTTVYHVGPIDQKDTPEFFAQNSLITPIKKMSINVTINSTSPSISYLPIPVDYRNGTITLMVNSPKPVDLELWNGRVLIDPLTVTFGITGTYPASNSTGPYLLPWPIDKAGYFTIKILDKEFKEAFNVTLSIYFYSYFYARATYFVLTR